ncbi:hypothetical protein [Nocardia thraciensis]
MGGGGSENSSTFLHGTDANNSIIRFSPDDVSSIPVRDPSGGLLGVSFPTKDGDAKIITEWASQGVRTSDHVYLPLPHDLIDGMDRGVPLHTFADKTPDWAFKPSVTPWSKDVKRTGFSPVYVDAHADGSSFGIGVHPGGADKSESIPVTVDGATYGRVLEANRYFQSALGEKPGSPLVLLSCDTGKPGAVSAESLADRLQNEAGIRRDVHAATGVVSLVAQPATGQSLLVAGADDAATPFRSFWAPRDPPDG